MPIIEQAKGMIGRFAIDLHAAAAAGPLIKPEAGVSAPLGRLLR
jgi:hypothetical protein